MKFDIYFLDFTTIPSYDGSNQVKRMEFISNNIYGKYHLRHYQTKRKFCKLEPCILYIKIN